MTRLPADPVERARSRPLEELFDAVVVLDVDGRIVEWDAGAERLFGYTRQEALGRAFHAFHALDAPEEAVERNREILVALERDGRWRGELALVRPDGSRGWIESAVVALHDGDGGRVGALAVHRDITARVEEVRELRAAEARYRRLVQDASDRHLAEQRLRSSEERYRLIARASTDVFRDWDVESGTVEWGPSAAATFHYAAAELEGRIEWWSNRIHPEDRIGVVRALYAVLNGLGDSWTGEYRFRRGDGEYAMVLDRACVVRTASGHAARVVSSMQDVTARRKNEEAQAFLARASALLDASLEREAMLASVARLSVPFLGECCFVDLVDPATGELDRVAVVLAAPLDGDGGEGGPEDEVVEGEVVEGEVVEGEVVEGEGVEDEVVEDEVVEDGGGERPIEGTGATAGEPAIRLVRHVVRSREAMLVRELGDPSGPGRGPLAIGDLRHRGLRSLMVVPLVVRGEGLGALTFGASATRPRYNPVDLGVAENLADRVARALDNARLYREARAAVDARRRLASELGRELRDPLEHAVGALDDLLAALHGPLADAHREPVERARRGAARALDRVREALGPDGSRGAPSGAVRGAAATAESTPVPTEPTAAAAE